MTHYTTVVFLGDACTGKTNIIRCLRGELASVNYEPTVGAEVYSTTHRIKKAGEENIVDMSLWECPGNERFLASHGSPILAADICVLVCDVCVPDTLHHLSSWHDEFLQSSLSGPAPAAFVVVANKIDLKSSRNVTPDHLAGWCGDELVDPSLWLKDLAGADALPIPIYIEVNTRDDTGIDNLKDTIALRSILRQEMNRGIPKRIHSIDEEQAQAAAADRRAVRCVLFGESEKAKEQLLMAYPQGSDGSSDPYSAVTETIERPTSTFTSIPHEKMNFAVWTPMSSQATTPFWFCRGAHVCIFNLELSITVNLYRLALWKEVFLRESSLRDHDSVAWVVVGTRTRNYLPNTTTEAAEFCERNGYLFIDLQEEPDSQDLLSVWEEVGHFANTHRQNLIIQRSADQSLNTIAFCPNKEHGCNWQGKASDAEHHYKKACLFARVQCRFEGCEETIAAGDRENHERFCTKRPATCHFCDRPYGVSLVEHLKLCEKREAFENAHVQCPLADFGCPVRYVKRSEVATHIAGDAPRHMEILSTGLQRLRNDLLDQERAYRMELSNSDDAHKAEVSTLREELERTQAELGDTKEAMRDMRIELNLLWEEFEAQKKKYAAVGVMNGKSVDTEA